MGKHHSKAYWRKFYALQAESRMEFNNAPGSVYTALDAVSTVKSDDDRGKPRVRQGNTWRSMGGHPVIPYGSERRTHGPRENHTLTAREIFERMWEYEGALMFAQEKRAKEGKK